MGFIQLITKFFAGARVRPEMSNDQEIDRKYKYWRIRIMYSMFVGYGVFYFTRKSFTFALPFIVKVLPITKVEIGMVASAFYITYGLSKFLSGVISDRSNPRYFMAFGLIMTGVLNILFGFFYLSMLS